MTAGDNMTLNINDRERQVLRAVIDMYLEGAEPVGSRSIVKKTGLGVSSATIRNVMADLEDIGLLYQPHVSAGRVPTEKGLKFYIDNLLERKGLSQEEKEAIQKELVGIEKDVDKLVKKAVNVLAKISGQVALAMAPVGSENGVIHIELVPIAAHKIMIVCIYRSGLAHTKTVCTKKAIDRERIERINSYLKDRIDTMSIKEIRDLVIREMKQDKRIFDALMQESLSLDKEDIVFIGGASNLIDQPEFKNIERLKQLLKAFEDKKTLVEILEAAGKGESVSILLGEDEVTTFIPGCGAVVASYDEKGIIKGSLGILGPMRMDYGKIMSLVEYTARLLGHEIYE